MKPILHPHTPRSMRRVVILGLLALIIGWCGLLGGRAATAAPGSSATIVGRQIFLPMVINGTSTSPPDLTEAGLSYAVELSPARQVASGELLRATISAHNGGPTALLYANLTLRYQYDQLGYERVEGDNIVAIGQSGDYTNVAFRRIDPGATVSGTLLFRVRNGLTDGTTITVSPEYLCESGICKANLVQVQVKEIVTAVASADDRQELLVAPASGGLDTVFRFSSRKFPNLDRVELWLSSDVGGLRRLPQGYRVGADGWVRFEIDGATFGAGSWNLMAYGGISGFSSIVSFTVSATASQGQALAALPLPDPSAASPNLPPSAAPASTATTNAAPAQVTAAGGMAGRVTDAATGTGVPDVLILLSRDGVPVTSAQTNAGGSYLIPVGLISGSYTVRALAASAGGALTYQDAVYPQPVVVTAPDLAAGIDFALAPGGNIAGHVTANDTQRGLGGVAIEVLSASGAVAGSGATAADGSYHVEGLPAGTYRLRVNPTTGDDGDVVAYTGTTFADVIVTVGATVVRDVALSVQTTVAAIRGQVTGTGGGLPGVMVATFNGQGKLVDLTRSTADGRYATGPLANGSYRLAFITFFADNATSRSYISAYYGNSSTFAGATPVTISGPGVVANINIGLTVGGAIEGVIRGSDAATLAGVLVAAYDAAGSVQSVSRSDSTGAYTLAGLTAGDYRVGFFARYADGTTVRRYQDAFYNGKASLVTADVVSVAAGATVANINATLLLGGQIGGRVTADDGGAGLPGIVVIAVTSAGGIAAATFTDATGAYQTSGLAPGAYTLLFDTIFAPTEASRGYIDEYFDNRDAPPYTPVTVVAGATATANAGLARGGQIAGRVTAGDSGLGLSGVAVLVFSGNTLVSFTMTDLSGAYTTPGLSAGSYALQFNPTLAADQDTAQYVAQTRAGAVSVSVGTTTAHVDAALARP